MHKIGYVVFPGFQLLGFAAVTAFEIANLQSLFADGTCRPVLSGMLL